MPCVLDRVLGQHSVTTSRCIGEVQVYCRPAGFEGGVGGALGSALTMSRGATVRLGQAYASHPPAHVGVAISPTTIVSPVRPSEPALLPQHREPVSLLFRPCRPVRVCTKCGEGGGGGLCVPVRVHATAWLCCTLPPPCSSSDNEAPQAVGPLPGDICPLHIGARPHCLWAAMQMAFGVSSNKLPRGAPTIDKASIPRELILRASTARYQTGLSDDG